MYNYTIKLLENRVVFENFNESILKILQADFMMTWESRSNLCSSKAIKWCLNSYILLWSSSYDIDYIEVVYAILYFELFIVLETGLIHCLVRNVYN